MPAPNRPPIRVRALIPVLAGILLAGCATTPESLQGEFSALRPGTATAVDTGTQVRWGGQLLEVRPERERTCFEILALPLGDSARPDGDATPGRRFLACRDGFADPAAYPQERLITVTGALVGFDDRTIGEYDYRYPRVDVRSLHLWPRELERARPHPVGTPWWDDPYPYGFRHRHPFWGPRYW